METYSEAIAPPRSEGGLMQQNSARQNYDVFVNVSEPEPRVVLLSINPERVLLNGRNGDTITWTLSGSGGEFQTVDDIQFLTNGGKNRFQLKFVSATQIAGVVIGNEENQTVYTYYVTVHFPAYDVALRVDPEIDNPPPPPT